MNSIEPVDPRIATLPHSGQGASSHQAGAHGKTGGETTLAPPPADLMNFHTAEGRVPADALAALTRLTQALAQQPLPAGAPPQAQALPAGQAEQAAQDLQKLLQSEIAQRQPGQWVQKLGEWAGHAATMQGGSNGENGTMAQILQSVLRDLFQANLAGASPAPTDDAPAPPSQPAQQTPAQQAPASTPNSANPSANTPQSTTAQPGQGGAPQLSTGTPAATTPPATASTPAKSDAPAAQQATQPPSTNTPAAAQSPAAHPASPAAVARLQALVDMARVQSSLAGRASADATPLPGGQATPAGVTVHVDPARAAQLLDEAPSQSAAQSQTAPSNAKGASHAPRTDTTTTTQPSLSGDANTARAHPNTTAPGTPAATAQEGASTRETGNAKLEALGFRVPEGHDPGAAAAKDGARPAQQTYLWETIVPVELNKATVPARLRLEWQEPRDGEHGEDSKAAAKPSVLSLAIETEALGRMSFHLAWMAKEVAGTVWIERPEVAEAADGELGHLHRRLQQAGVPDPNLEIRHGHEGDLPDAASTTDDWHEERAS